MAITIEYKRRVIAEHNLAEYQRLRAAEEQRLAEELEIVSILLPGNVALKLIRVKAGSFTMGSPSGEEGRIGNEQQHKVEITKDYWLGQYEVTQGQWEAVMETNPSNFRKGGNYPVEEISWNDAMEFCAKLNRLYKDELPKGYKFSLPTEAQWEYACRAGGAGLYSGGTIDEVAWYKKNCGYTHPVGLKKSNAWGFYDMHGNVWEWCSDWYGKYDGDAEDPKGPENGSGRVIRGGAWNSDADDCRSANRGNCSLTFYNVGLGFRLALVPVQETASVSRNNSQPSKREVVSKTISLPGNVALKLIRVKAGSFVMGSPSGESGREDGEQQHKVKITQDYWLGQYEVTQGQWEAVMGSNPSNFRKGGNYPVEKISWNDAMEFCAKLNRLYEDELPKGYQFSLPTEAQWEYVCRARETGPYSGGAIDEVAWYCDNSDNTTHPVGLKKSNAWGFYDMHGNVQEWCSDRYGKYNGDVKDPVGPKTGSYRVSRGGSWRFNARFCRAADRDDHDPSLRRYDHGFRLALVPVQE